MNNKIFEGALFIFELIIINSIILSFSLITLFALFIPLACAAVYYFDHRNEVENIDKIKLFIKGIKLNFFNGIILFVLYNIILTVLFTNLLYQGDVWFNNFYIHVLDFVLILWTIFTIIISIYIGAKYKLKSLKLLKISFMYTIYNIGLMILVVLLTIGFTLFALLTVGFIFIYFALLLFIMNKIFAKSLNKIFIIEEQEKKEENVSVYI